MYKVLILRVLAALRVLPLPKVRYTAAYRLRVPQILNLDQSWCEQWRALIADKNLITYSVQDRDADLSASAIQLLSNGCYQFVLCVAAMADRPAYKQQIELSVPGAHQINNALAAAACAIAAGANGQQIAAGLAPLTRCGTFGNQNGT